MQLEEKQLRITLDTLLEGVQIIGYDWKYLYVNDAVATQGKYSKEELLGHTMMEKYPGIENTDLFRALTASMNERMPRLMENEFTYPDGSKGWYKLSIQPAPEGIIILSMDITQRKKAEEKLRTSEIRYRRLFETAKDGILILNADTGEIVDVNPFLTEMLGYSHSELLCKQLWEIGFFKDILENKAAFEKLKKEGYIRYENLPLKTKEGNSFWVEFVSNVYDVGGRQVIQCNIRDITDRKKAEQEIIFQNKEKEKWADELALANVELVFQNNEKGKRAEELSITNNELIKSEEKLIKSETHVRNFAAHLNKVIEDERASIAREMHDELGQQLTGIKMGLALLKKKQAPPQPSPLGREKKAPPAPDSSPDGGGQEGALDTMMKDVDNTIQSVRKIATQLRPGILDTLGLIPSIKWLGDEFEKKTGIRCKVHSNFPPSGELKGAIATCFFRICQEALNNISKHAKASEVTIEIRQEAPPRPSPLGREKNVSSPDGGGQEGAGELILKISDNGKGIASEKLENPFSMGLLGMRERAKIIGGDLQITSKKDFGTSIALKANLN